MEHGSIPGETSADIIETIAQASGVRARSNISGREVTTVCAGGPLRALFEPDSPDELCKLLTAVACHGASSRILGAGSNLLIDDAGIAACVIRLGSGFRDVVSVSDGVVDVGAACGLMRVSRNLSRGGFSGLEFASGIPASVGGAVRMNAGAHGGQMADIIESVECVAPAGEVFRLSAKELAFAYRSSALPPGAVVIGVRMRLTAGDTVEIERRRSELLAYRKATQPLTQPSFGSVFKNPTPERSAGAIIEAAGLKGRRIGGAEISQVHGNWIVNPERSATVAEIRQLIDLCRSTAATRGEPPLEAEVILWADRAQVAGF